MDLFLYDNDLSHEWVKGEKFQWLKKFEMTRLTQNKNI